jgi:hypothetical protein
MTMAKSSSPSHPNPASAASSSPIRISRRSAASPTTTRPTPSTPDSTSTAKRSFPAPSQPSSSAPPRIHGRTLGLSLIEDAKLAITTTDLDGVATTREIPGFELHDDRESSLEFQVPERTLSVAFELTGRVRSLSRGENVDLRASDVFHLNAVDRTEHTEALLLERMADGYRLYLLGKTGEPRASRPVQLEFKHRDFRDPVHTTLRTDDAGALYLGVLEGIAVVSAQGPGGQGQSWTLLEDAVRLPAAIHGAEGEPLFVPWVAPDGELRRERVSLLELRGPAYLRDRFDALSVENGMLKLSGLPAGDYELRLKEQQHALRVRITPGETQAGHVQSARRLLETPSTLPIQIESIEERDDVIRIQVRNAGAATRVHVAATRFHPEYSLFARLGAFGPAGLSAATLGSVESHYVSGRNIGDEYRYILERKYAEKFPGNMLDRPGLLLNPWAIRETRTGVQAPDEGEVWERAASEMARREAAAGIARQAPMPSPAFSPNLDFLAHPAVLLTNIEPNGDGIVEIDRKALGDKGEIHVLAVDTEQSAYRRLALTKAPPAAVRDLRLAGPLDPDARFSETRRIQTLAPGESITLDDVRTSRLELYDSLAKAYRLYVTLSNDDTLREFAFILRWPGMTESEKREKYSEYASHELNVFLARKDPAFFEAVVRPYIQNKKDRTFVDRYLLGEELTAWLEPAAYRRLNVVERILLARRHPDHAAATLRHLRDLNDLVPPDPDRWNFLFETALKGSALESAAAPFTAELDRLAALGYVGGEPAGEMFDAAVSFQATPTAALREGIEKAAPAPTAPARDDARRRTVRQLYRPVDRTKEWAENNYYHLPRELQNGDLIPVSAFWVDFAAHDGDAPFLSEHMAEASGSFAEIMLALAALDLPFEAPETEGEIADGALTLRAEAPTVAYLREIRTIEPDADALPILVTQNFFRLDDRFSFEGNERRDKFVRDEFLVHVPYGAQVVVTNPTSTPAKLSVLLQIPEGALPLMSGHFTRALSVDLQPFSTRTIEYIFYFPLPGEFVHYPVHVSRGDRIVAWAAPVKLNAVRTLSEIDRTSWEYISQYGGEDDVIGYLSTQNLGRVDLARIAWRMSDRDFFRSVLDILDGRRVYNDTLWSYGLHHNDLPAIRAYLDGRDDFVSQCGARLSSTLLDIDPVVRGAYEHFEYDPLINPRAHRLGAARRILNDRFHAQYHAFLRTLAYRPELTDDDRLALTYYLLLQDRVGEAIDWFARVDRGALPTAMQYDYAAAYLDFYRGDPAAARAAAAPYADYPVDKWRRRFAAVLAQADEIDGGGTAVVDPDHRDQAQGRLAATEPAFDFTAEAGSIQIRHRNLEACRVSFYLMDVELLFSRDPFVQEFSGQFSSIRPNASMDVELSSDSGTTSVDIPEALRHRNLMIEVAAAGRREARPYYSGALVVQLIENYGQVLVTADSAGRPLPRVYVKVYARMKGGDVRFYKDGYTDLRGRFEYASLSTDELENVDRFALLILSDEHGAEVREAAPPGR